MAKKRRRKPQQRTRTATKLPQRQWPWRVALIIIILIGVGTLLWSPWSQPGRVPPGAIIAAEQSAPAPLFTLASASGEPIQLADYLGQQPVVLAFYMGDF